MARRNQSYRSMNYSQCGLQGQALSKNSTFESLQLLPFEFLVSSTVRHRLEQGHRFRTLISLFDGAQVALPMASKKDALPPPYSTRIGLATDSVSALTQATQEHPTSHTLPDAQKLSDQEDTAHALTDTMSLSPGLYTLLPGYVSRPQVPCQAVILCSGSMPYHLCVAISRHSMCMRFSQIQARKSQPFVLLVTVHNMAGAASFAIRAPHKRSIPAKHRAQSGRMDAA